MFAGPALRLQAQATASNAPTAITFHTYHGVYAPVDLAKLAEANALKLEITSSSEDKNERDVWVLDKSGYLLSLDRQSKSLYQNSFSRITFQYLRKKLIRQETSRWTEKNKEATPWVDSLVWEAGKITEIHRLNEPGTKKTYEYDQRDSMRCYRIHLPKSPVFSEQWFSYAEDGNLLEDSTVREDRGTNVWNYTYDDQGHNVRKHFVSFIKDRKVLESDMQFIYGLNGKVLKSTTLDKLRGNASTISYQYDIAGRNTYRAYHKQQSAETVLPVLEHEYWIDFDDEGRIVRKKSIYPRSPILNSETRYTYATDGLRVDYIKYKGESNTLSYTGYEIKNPEGFPVKVYEKKASGEESHYQYNYSKAK